MNDTWGKAIENNNNNDPKRANWTQKERDFVADGVKKTTYGTGKKLGEEITKDAVYYTFEALGTKSWKEGGVEGDCYFTQTCKRTNPDGKVVDEDDFKDKGFDPNKPPNDPPGKGLGVGRQFGRPEDDAEGYDDPTMTHTNVIGETTREYKVIYHEAPNCGCEVKEIVREFKLVVNTGNNPPTSEWTPPKNQ
jgi:hypothetical protein